MKKVAEYYKGDLIGRLFENQVAHEKCYTFKIYKGKPVKGNLVAMSYVYYIKEERCKEELLESLNQISLVDKEF